MPTPSVEKLKSQLIAALELRPEILEAYLFGSQALGLAQPHSDIDVAVYVMPTYPLDRNFGYQAELTAALMAALHTNIIDLVLLNRAPPLLYHRIITRGIRLMSRNLAHTTTREGAAISRYCDFLPQLAKIEAVRRRPPV